MTIKEQVAERIITTPQAKYLLGAQPVATLLQATPEWVVAQATMGYTGTYQAEPLTKEQQETFWTELGKTKLKGPLEMAQTFWLVENVTRAFTHQLARYRLGTSMVQESQRFSVQVATEVVSLQPGNPATIMVPLTVVASGEVEEFIQTCETAMAEYHSMISDGIPVQDARSVLPTHICTRLYLSVNMASLSHIYEQRSCCQADHAEWYPIIRQMRSQLYDQGFTHYAGTLMAPWEDKNCISCGFGANFDRPCKHQHLFDRNLNNAWLERIFDKG